MASALREARESAGEVVLLYTDEVTLYRQPSQASLWHWRGRLQPKLRYSHRSNTRMRVVGLLDACTGGVISSEHSKVTARRLAQCWQEAASSYLSARKVYLVMDNWPVHFHPRVLETLAQDPRIEILPLPTYSPWLNPIEKVWRMTKQRVCHTHPWCDDFNAFRRQVMEELSRYRYGSQEMLRYVGLGQ